MRPEFWERRANAIRECAERGLSKVETARELRLFPGTVRTYAKKFEISFQDKPCREGRPSGGVRGRKSKVDPVAFDALLKEGLTRQEIADRLGVSYSNVIYFCHRHGIEIQHASARCPKVKKRAEDMAAMYRSGRTLEQIGSLYGITRERVRQLISKHCGITGRDGGKAARGEANRRRHEARRDAKSLSNYGCTYAKMQEVRALGKAMRADGVSYYRTPIGAFQSQRSSARWRGITWSLKFWEWWTVWQQSGKWADRGLARDAYVMCRFGDVGPYEVGNVYIATLGHNSAVQPNNPYRSSHPDFEKVMAERERAHKATCSVDGCDRPHYAHGICQKHYQRDRYLAQKAAAYQAEAA